MRKTFLISQLACISVLFAPEGDHQLPSSSVSGSNGSWVLHEQNDAQSEAGSRYSFPVSQLNQSSEAGSGEAPSLNNLDSIMFNRWYGDYFKTQEVDGVSYFVKMMNAGQMGIRFRLSEMGPDAQVSEVSAVVPGVVEDIFKTSDRQPVRFKYTVKKNMQCSEVKYLLESLVYKLRKSRDDMINGLNEACRYRYEHRLPLDNIEIQDADNVFYLICGIAQEGVKHLLVKEPESIRIQLRLQENCPECYMDKEFLSMYYRIYSSLNQGLMQSLAGASKFMRIQGYSQIPDILKKQLCWSDIRETISYLAEDELEPVIYIPTYQHDALIYNGYESLPFKRTSNNSFKTERVYGLEYSVDVAGVDDRFMVSDLGKAEIDRLKVSYKGESGTEFIHEITAKVPGTTVRDMFKDMLSKVKDLESKFTQIGTNHPISLVRIRKEEDGRYLDLIVDTNAPRLQIKLGEDEADTKYLAEENLEIYHQLHTELQRILGSDVESTDVYVEVPEVLNRQTGWSDLKDVLMKQISNVSILIQPTQRDALINKGSELLTFTHDNGDVFKTELMHDLVYSVSISDTSGLSDTFKLSDLADKEITGLSIDISSGAFRYSMDKTTPGSEVSSAFKDALQHARKVRDESILAKFPLKMVSVQEDGDKRSLTILPSDMGIKKLNPVELNEGDIEKYLTQEKFTKYRGLCELVRCKTKELLKGMTEFADETKYSCMSDMLKREEYWPKAEALLEDLGDNVSFQVLGYLYDALTKKISDLDQVALDKQRAQEQAAEMAQQQIAATLAAQQEQILAA